MRQIKLKKEDHLYVLGDVIDRGPHGNHEMRPESLPGYEKKEWHGGTVLFEPEFPSILFAVDGEIYDFEGKSTLIKTGFLVLSDAVQVAIDFAAEHPDETLIIVTADHETGGMTIGFATTGYDTHFGYLTNQTISFTDFDAVIAELREKDASFAEAMVEVGKYYGLTTAADQPLSLTAAELTSLRTAYAMSMGTGMMTSEEAALLYGGYEPFSMAISHIINNKAGLSYTSYAHTGLQIPVYAMGAGAELFSGMYDNTDIFNRTMEAMGLTR